jgi:hypothetical protein
MGSTVRPRDLLEQIAHLVDAAGVDLPHLDPFAVVVERIDGEVVLGLRCLHAHPTVALAGLVAPPSWWALLLCTSGHAHLLASPNLAPEPIVSTYGRSRDGDEVSLLRRGSSVTELTGPAEGRIPDLVRAILSTTPEPERTGS